MHVNSAEAAMHVCGHAKQLYVPGTCLGPLSAPQLHQETLLLVLRGRGDVG